MHKRWLLLGATLLMAVLAVAFVACGDDEDEEEEATPTAEEIETPPAGETPAETPAEGETPQAEAVEVTLVADPGYEDVAGTATLTGVDGSIDVVVTVDGGLEEGSHQNHIHAGTCESRGDVEEALTNLEAGADGSAEATTSIAEELSHFTDGGHYVAVHAIDGTVVACGNIEAAS